MIRLSVNCNGWQYCIQYYLVEFDIDWLNDNAFILYSMLGITRRKLLRTVVSTCGPQTLWFPQTV